jgi:hypothetical protein
MFYSVPAEQVVGSVYKYISSKHNADDQPLLDVLRRSEPTIEWTSHDNWNGGIDYYTLFLRVSIQHFAEIDSDLKLLEGELAGALERLTKGNSSELLNSVSIVPDLREPIAIGSPIDNQDQDGLWKPGHFRLFVSHSSVQKTWALRLKEVSLPHYIDCFVAHEDIEPTTEWRIEIERALRTMDAMVAMVTQDFKSSAWTHQEVGFALGRGIPIFSVMHNATPLGFLGKDQGLAMTRIKERLPGLIETHPQTSKKYRRALCLALLNSWTFNESREIARRLPKTLYTKEERDILRSALRENRQVYDAEGVPDILTRLVSLGPEPAPTTK